MTLVFLIDLCPVPECTFPDTHHHLEECEGRATGCDGKTDEYGQTQICCNLGPLYDPAWPAARLLSSMTREEARDVLSRPAPYRLGEIPKGGIY